MMVWLPWLVPVALMGLGTAVMLWLVWDSLHGRTPMPTSPRVRRMCCDMMRALPGVRRAVDLGAGTGVMLRAFVRAAPEAHWVGIEASWLVYGAGRLLTRGVRRRAGADYRLGDALDADLRTYHAVFCYLNPPAMVPMALKLRRELPVGAWVVSNTFALPGWTPLQVVRADDFYRTPIYLYQQT